jgi:hypothetical protein
MVGLRAKLPPAHQPVFSVLPRQVCPKKKPQCHKKAMRLCGARSDYLGDSKNAVAFDLAARSHETPDMNSFVARHIKAIEMIGVLMRVFSFSLVSWLGPKSPLMFVWIFNTTDAVLLTWCATLKRDNAYLVLNGFWILVGIVGILRAGNILH